MLSKLIFALVLIGCIYLAALVYYRNPKSRDNRLFVFNAFWMIMWLIVNYIENEPIGAEYRTIFLKLDFVIAPILSYFWFLFCYNFLESKSLSKFFNRAIIISVVFSVLAVLMNFVVYDIDATKEIIKFKLGFLFPAYAVFIFIYLVGGPSLLVLKYKRLKGRQRIQALYVLTGFLLSALISVVINLFLQDILSVEYFRIATYSVLFMIIFTSFAITRHKLFDIRSLLQRSLIFSSVFILIVGIFLLTLNLSGYFFYKTSSVSASLAAAITTLIGILTLPYLERFLKKITDRIFYKDIYDPTEALIKLSRTLNESIDTGELVKNALYELKKIIKVNHLEFCIFKDNIVYTENGKRKMDKNFAEKDIKDTIYVSDDLYIFTDDIPDMIRSKKLINKNDKAIEVLGKMHKLGLKRGHALYFVLKTSNNLLGSLMLGEKKSGEAFSKTDVGLLRTFSNQMAISLEHSHLYEKVKEYSENLEEKVEERTREISGLQEEQKLMMLEIAHSLQTPLTILKSELSAIRKDYKNPEKVKRLEGTLDRISRFIYDMLKLARLGTNNEENIKEELNLSSLLTELVDEFDIICSEKDIVLKKEIEENIFIQGNIESVSDAITNLVSNGVKYMDANNNNKKLEIKLIKSGDNVLLSVKDNGVGIREKDKYKVFKRFFRENNDSNSPGTGLGLAITKKIIDLHNGKIYFESQEGEGSVFYIELPIISNL